MGLLSQLPWVLGMTTNRKADYGAQRTKEEGVQRVLLEISLA